MKKLIQSLILVAILTMVGTAHAQTPPPTVGNNGPVCAGSTLNLTASSPALYFASDNFNRANGSPGSQWTIANGTWAISGNQLAQNAGAAGPQYIYANTLKTFNLGGGTNFTMQATVQLNTGTSEGTSSAGILFNYQDNNNFYALRYFGNGNVQFYRMWNGGEAAVASGSFTTVQNRAYRLTVSSIGLQHYSLNIYDTVTSTSVYNNANADGGIPFLNGYGGCYASANTSVQKYDDFSLVVTPATYAWTGPSSFSSSLQNPTISGATTANSGTYSCTVTVATNGTSSTSSSATTSVTVNASPSAPTAGNNGPISTGSTLNLTASTVSGATYSWTGPNSFNSAAQNPSIANATTAATGTYSVTATVSGCASSAGTTAATVNAIPSAPTVGNNGPICAGSALNLTASSPALYAAFDDFNRTTGIGSQWTIANGTWAISGNQLIQNGGAGGLQAIYANTLNTYNLGGGTNFTMQATVQLNTSSSDGSSAAGILFNYQDNNNFYALRYFGNGTVQFYRMWNGGEAACASGSFTPVQNRPYRLTVSSIGPQHYSLNIYDTVTSTSVYNNANADGGIPFLNGYGGIYAGANTVVMSYDNFSLTVSPATYAWTGPNSFSSTAQNPTISGATAANSGTYSCTVTVAMNGTSSTSSAATTSVTVNASPSAPTAGNNGPISTGSTLNLTASTVSGATYSWTGPNSFNSTAQNPSIANATTAATGTYSVTATVSGCTSSAGTTAATVNAIPSSPTVGNNGPICAGSALNLTASSPALYAAFDDFNRANGSLGSQWTIANGTWAVSGNQLIQNGGAAGQQYIYANTLNTYNLGGGTNFTMQATVQLNTAYGDLYTWAGIIFNFQDLNNFYAFRYDGAGYVQLYRMFNGAESAPLNVTGFTPVQNRAYRLTVSSIGPQHYSLSIYDTVSATTVYNNADADGGIALLNGYGGLYASINSGVMTYDDFSLTASPATYAWTGPSSFSSTAQNPTISDATTANSGTYSCTVTVAMNGTSYSSSSATTTATVDSRAVAPTSASASVNPTCSGGATILSVSGGSAGTAGALKWYADSCSGASIGSGSLSVSPTTTTTYYGRYETPAPCSDVTECASVTVTVNPAAATSAITGSGTVASGQLGQTYSVALTSGSSYAWTVPSGASITAGDTGPNNNQISVNFGTASGSVGVTETTAGNCVGAPVTLAVTVTANHAPVAPPNKTLSTAKNTAAAYVLPKLLVGATDADNDTLSVTAASTPTPHGGTVLLEANDVKYTPATDYMGSDSYTYTISDGNGGTAIGTVNVTVTDNGGGSPNVVVPPTYTNGTFRVTFAGIPTYAYSIEYAESPTGPWTFLKTAVACTNGLFEVVDEPLPQTPARYYRTVYP